jgi:tetratricopeptide (TPR) repeat protein
MGQSDPPSAELLRQAISLHQQGALDEAERAYRAVLAERPRDPEACRHLGFLLQERGRLREAVALITAAVEARPEDPDGLGRLAAVLNGLGRPADALKVSERALALDPDLADALNAKGGALMRLGRPAQALKAYDRLLARTPLHLPALINRGAALRDLGRAEEALRSYERVLAVRPGHAMALNNRGVALMDLGRPHEAAASFDQALKANPNYAEALNNRGRALAVAETELSIIAEGDARAREALASFDRAIALRPDYAEAHDNKAALLFELGRFWDAARAAERAIRLAPRTARYYYHLAEMRRFASGDPFLEAMQRLAAEPDLPDQDRIELEFAIGKALADVGEPEAAFAHAAAGARLKRAAIAYDEAAALGDLARIRDGFSARLLARRAGVGDPSPLPVFVVGLPRSGTTLVEQILASHPLVAGAGETSAFAAGLAPEALRDPTALTDAALRKIGSDYVAALAAAAPGAHRVVNKRPDNFRLAGLIRLALPEARIIHVRRDPMDVGLSLFFRLFGDEVPYSFDLGEIGRYIRAYEALMAHWREVMPPETFLEVDYEALVADLEGQTRRMLAHCGLDFDRRCLDFHLTDRRIRTASAAQVRQPLNAGSAGRWRAYEPWLGTLKEALSA